MPQDMAVVINISAKDDYQFNLSCGYRMLVISKDPLYATFIRPFAQILQKVLQDYNNH